MKDHDRILRCFPSLENGTARRVSPVPGCVKNFRVTHGDPISVKILLPKLDECGAPDVNVLHYSRQ